MKDGIYFHDGVCPWLADILEQYYRQRGSPAHALTWVGP